MKKKEKKLIKLQSKAQDCVSREKAVKLLKKYEKPTLLYTSPKGTTIHSYDIEGGQKTFNHYLKCYEGSCEFHKTLDEARKAVKF